MPEQFPTKPVAPVALVGLGTVGMGVCHILSQARARIARRAGRAVEVAWAVVRDLARPRDCDLPAGRLTRDWRQAVTDPSVEIVIELIGGLDTARQVVLQALASGKHVVTANKALLAEHGSELFAAARAARRVIAFEGSVGGGIPIVQAVSVGLAANQVQSLAAIVNGTCNYILTAMTTLGVPYEEALKQAQRLGYAESDPTLDVNGTDAAHKLAILAQLAFGASVSTSDIQRQGIDRLDTADIRYAAELGYTIKLLAQARLAHDQSLTLAVAPRLVHQGTPLADVRDAYNAIRVVGDFVGDTLFYGPGAGALPTASAVVSDLIDVASGRATQSGALFNLWPDPPAHVPITPISHIRDRFYLRFMISDRPGVLGQIALILGGHGISIASVIQHEPGPNAAPGDPVPLVLMTHQAPLSGLLAALGEIDGLQVVTPPSVWYGVEE